MIAGIDKLIKEAIDNSVMPGGNYALIAKGKKYFASFGKKALIPEVEENDLNTLYDMASLTKVVVTTTSILLLLEQGKLRLFDQVSLYVPEFIHKDITIWDLLTHTGGLPADVSKSSYSNKEELLAQIMNVELKYTKNTRIVYSDIGFMLLGFVVANVSQMPLDEFAKKNIFKPLEMSSSTYNPTDVKRCAPTEDRKTHIDRGYVHDEKAYQLGGVSGHAGLFSTVKDVSNFMEMILNDGLFKGKKFLSRQSIDLIYTVQVEEANGISRALSRRSLGWIVKGDFPVSGDLASPNTIMHTGFTGTHIFIDRDNKVAFSLLTNRVHPTRENNLLNAFRGRLGNYILSHLDEIE